MTVALRTALRAGWLGLCRRGCADCPGQMLTLLRSATLASPAWWVPGTGAGPWDGDGFN